MNIQNPYPTLGPKIKTALDYIINNMVQNPSFENLNDAVSDAIYIPDPNDPAPLDPVIPFFLRTVLPNVYNSYVFTGAGDEEQGTGAVTLSSLSRNGGIVEGLYKNKKQQQLIASIFQGLKTTAPEQVEAYLSTVEEKIVSARLPYDEQAPLFLSVAAGKAVYQYWQLQIPQPSPWAAYMLNPMVTPQANDALNYGQLPHWTAAAMQGALLAWGMIKPPQLQPVDVMTATVGAIGLGAGKVVFRWVEG